MKRALILLAAAAAAAVPAAAQDFGRPLPLGAYADDGPLPPRPVPGYGGTETVITTTRRVVAPSSYGVYAVPQTVVTTRRVLAPAPVLEEPDHGIVTGSLRPAVYPPPSRRVLKSGPDFEPAPYGAPLVRERVVVTRRAAEPVVVEERRVVTTRRILHPAPVEPLDWDE
jgi:hypothetical protein